MAFMILVAAMLTLVGCQYKVVEPAPKDTYIVLGHPYQWHSSASGQRIDPRLESHDFSQYLGVILGGDVCTETTLEESTLNYLDDLFDLSNPNSHWAVGNHDVRNDNTQWITERTGRDLFYFEIVNNVGWMVLNTSFNDMSDLDDPCQYRNDQIEMVYKVFDTLSAVDQLVILTHHVVWGESEPDMIASELANADRSWINFTCDSIVRFHTQIYPRIRHLRRKGISVAVISGDGGQYTKQYHYRSSMGVNFFITGINNSYDPERYSPPRPFNQNPDSILLITQDLETQRLSFNFERLSKLLD